MPVGADRAGGKLNAPPWEVQRYLFLVFISLRLGSFFKKKSHQFNNNPKIGKLRGRGRGASARDTGGPAPGPSLLQGTPFRPHYCCCWAVGVGWGWAAIVLPQLTWGQNLPLPWDVLSLCMPRETALKTRSVFYHLGAVSVRLWQMAKSL